MTGGRVFWLRKKSLSKMSKPVFLVCLTFLVLNCSTEAARKDKTRNRNHQRVRDLSQMADVAGESEVCHLEVSCKSPTSGVPITLPIQGPKGPPGKQGQPGEPGRDGAPGLPGPPGNEQSKQPRVAFFAGLKDNKGPVAENTDLVFDSIVTNVGSAFGTETGRFTAPYNGTYHFTVVVAAQGRQRAAVDLVMNEKMVATVWAESIPYWASATNSAILTLREGDQVWLKLLSRASYIHGYMYSTFSGFCMFAD